MKKSLEKYEKKQITINLPLDLFHQIKILARQEQRSVSGQVVFLLAGGAPPVKGRTPRNRVFLPIGGEPPVNKTETANR